MREGWLSDEYLVLFDEEEASLATAQYPLGGTMPDAMVIGLRGWDDLLVRDSTGHLFTVPSVPLLANHTKPFTLPQFAQLEWDGRFTDRVKWYVTPLAFGGDPNDPANLTWVTHEQHRLLVVWWNQKYQELAGAN
ncbi:hypothetical protein [Chitinimonas naiadis]